MLNGFSILVTLFVIFIFFRGLWRHFMWGIFVGIPWLFSNTVGSWLFILFMAIIWLCWKFTPIGPYVLALFILIGLILMIKDKDLWS